MKRRRGRRGVWWWSWLLVLVTIGAVVGGFLYGKKRWEDAPKDFQSVATLSFHVRDPFVLPGKAALVSMSRMADPNEAGVLRETESDAALAPIVTEFDLTKKWELGTADALSELRTSLELELDREKNELYVSVIRHDPEEAAELANAVAKAIIPRIKELDEKRKVEGLAKQELELQPFQDEESESRASLKKVLTSKNIKIELTPGVDLGSYLFDEEILPAKLEWDSAIENLSSAQSGQSAYTNYWKKSVRPSLITTKAEPTPKFIGPALQPVQVEWSLYGLTAGLVVGSLLMLLCWKLFP